MTVAVARSWFRCRNCGATMGELVGVRLVVIAHGLHVTFPLIPDACFTCRKCGEPNTLGQVLHSRAGSPVGTETMTGTVIPQDGRVQSA